MQKADLLRKLDLQSDNVILEDELEIKGIQLQLDQMYLDVVKGAFIRQMARRR